MKAVVINKFGSPEVFKLSECSEPIPKSDEILIEVVSASINPIDYKQRRGNHKFIFGSPFPIILGYDVAGIIASTGSDIIDFKVGDIVCGVLNNKYGGGLGQFALGNTNCFCKVSDSVDHLRSAVIPLAGLTALQALRDKSRININDKILIIGAAGGVGHFAVQLAEIYGAEVYAVSSQRHKAFLEKISNATFIDYQNTDILSLNIKFKVIFDTIGNYSFVKCKKLLEPGGIYINTLPRPKIIFHKMLSLFSNRKKARTLLMKHSTADLSQLLSWVESGKLKICIDKEFSIKDIVHAHEYIEMGHTEGKILIRYNWNE
jgi:NADPH:quinone reductase-like Zn-dependent oxidoreductase